MSEHVPASIDAIPIGIPLPFAIYVKVGGYYVKLRALGDELTKERSERLKKSLDFVFIKKDAWLSFLDYLENICDIETSDSLRVADNIHNLLLAYARHLEQMSFIDFEMVNKLRKISLRLVEITGKNAAAQNRLIRRYEEIAVYYSSHSVNVATYAIAIGRKIGLSDPDLSLLAFAGLVHNIGNSKLPNKLLYKQGKFTDTEWIEMQTHPSLGAKILASLGAPEEVVTTALQHHERIDGTGYPTALQGNKIHLFARICSIADVYDALTSLRPSFLNPPMEPKIALGEMQKMPGKFDPALLPMLGNA